MGFKIKATKKVQQPYTGMKVNAQPSGMLSTIGKVKDGIIYYLNSEQQDIYFCRLDAWDKYVLDGIITILKDY